MKKRFNRIMITKYLYKFTFFASLKHNLTTNNDKLVYNSYIDSEELLLYNENLTNITIHSDNLHMSYERCLQACFKQANLKTLSISTKLGTMETIHSNIILNSLTYLHLTIDSTKDFNRDHLNPILQCSKNLETIIYENGYLNDHSMFILTKLKKMDILILDNIQIHDYKAFSIMLFNLRVKTIVIRLKYAFCKQR